jgi:elongation factor 4
MLAAFRRRMAAQHQQQLQKHQQHRAFAAAADPEKPATTPPPRGFVGSSAAPADFPPSAIRNFSIIAHVDHGKSTLADALMKRLGAIPADARAQFLDRLEVERTRGITVKAQTASLVVPSALGVGGDHDTTYLLNLVDTPGHVDFSYEVSRSLAACQGALLLVDASQGVQAQTVATGLLALEQGLEIVPVLTKLDLPGADPQRARAEMRDTFGFRDDEFLEVSAKLGIGLDAVLRAVIERVPPPSGDPTKPLRLLLFDAYADSYRGVVSLVAAVDGVLRTGDRLASCAAMAAGAGPSGPSSASSPTSSLSLEALEVGVLAPEPYPTGELRAGQVGYVITGLRDLKAARVGDTWVARPTAGSAASSSSSSPAALALPGFRPAKAVVFAGIFPASADAYGQLSAAVERLALNDASVSVRKDHSDALGAGFRCGFLGPLHLDVFLQRLEQEHGAEVVASAPSVPVEVDIAAAPGQGGGRTTVVVEAPSDWPRKARVLEVREPTVVATIVAPQEYCGAVIELCVARRGEQLGHAFLGGGGGGGVAGAGAGAGATPMTTTTNGRVVLKFCLPLAELARGLYSSLKQATSGYASLDYEPGPLRPADLRLLEVLVNGAPLDPLARLVHSSEAERAGRALVSRLAGLLQREQFDVTLQAAVAGGRGVVARETVKARRRDVIAKCYGGDVSRKKKLLERQKEGKKQMRRLGSVRVSADVLPQLLKPV